MAIEVNSLADKKVIHFKEQIDDSINMINDDNLKKSFNKFKTKASSKSKCEKFVNILLNDQNVF